jgi:hypothetical protein
MNRVDAKTWVECEAWEDDADKSEASFLRGIRRNEMKQIFDYLP